MQLRAPLSLVEDTDKDSEACPGRLACEDAAQRNGRALTQLVEKEHSAMSGPINLAGPSPFAEADSLAVLDPVWIRDDVLWSWLHRLPMT